jgi:glycine/D-amino acid oxidase-like deaminating enzyme
MAHADHLVVGAGVLGLSIAWGLASRGAKVVVLDASDTQPRASTGNFGLVWLQSKGEKFPAYGAWTRTAIDAWPAFAQTLQDASGMDVRYRRSGGLGYCLGEEEWQARVKRTERMRTAHAIDLYDTVMLDRSELERRLSGIALGTEVVGASFNPYDGDVDPLRLMAALRMAVTTLGVVIHRGVVVDRVKTVGKTFTAHAGNRQWQAERIVLAAGLANAKLAPQLGLHGAVRADRGQILVTERVTWKLPLPGNGLRQTPDGTIVIGATKEGPEQDLQSTDPLKAAAIARRAVRTLPALRNTRVVRGWAGLRTLSADSAPVYAQAEGHPGAAVANSHSGITLAPLHASVLADWLLEGSHADVITPFSPRRFDVQVPR